MKNDALQTALHLAAADGSKEAKECAKLLMDAGASVHIRDAFGHTPIHLAIRSADHGYGNTTVLSRVLSHWPEGNLQEGTHACFRLEDDNYESCLKNVVGVVKKLVNSAASQEFEDKIRDFLNKGQGLQENQVLRAKQELGLLLVCAWDKLFVSVSDPPFAKTAVFRRPEGPQISQTTILRICSRLIGCDASRSQIPSKNVLLLLNRLYLSISRAVQDLRT